MKKLLSILFFIFVTQVSYGQTFTQTFVDRCTGEVQIVTANFQTGSAVVSFYNKVRVFTYQEYVNGELHQWLMTTYAWWQALSPCSAAQTQTTRLGLQVRFTDAETGRYLVGSGLGDAKTVKTQEGLIGLDVDEIAFRESGIGVATRKALETASARIVARMIRKGIFPN